MSDNETPTLNEVLRVCRDFGLVGEDATVLTVVLAILRGQLVIMTGPSRVGKDYVVDAAQQPYPADEMVYQWPVDDSATAAYYNRGEINSYPVQRFPDLASLPEHQEKILKAFGEGRDADRVFTDVSKDEGEEATSQVIQAPRTTIAFVASDNEKINLNDFPELRNRALIVNPDATEEQTANIKSRQAAERAGRVEREIEPFRKLEIQRHLGGVPVAQWTENSDYRLVNPAAIAVDEQEPIPSMFVEARQDFDRLLGFFETVTLYHHKDRMQVPFNNKTAMLVTPTDVWMAMKILGDQMVMSSLNLQQDDVAVISLLQEASANLSKSEVQQSLREQGFNITDRDVGRSLTSMREKGYVREFQSSPNEYTVSEFGSVVNHDAGLDYGALVKRTKEIARDTFDSETAEEYIARFCEGEGLHAIHPFKGYEVDITEDSDFDDEITEQEDKIAAILDDDPFPEGEEVDESPASSSDSGTMNQTLEGTL